jgi:hypothetical protein
VTKCQEEADNEIKTKISICDLKNQGIKAFLQKASAFDFDKESAEQKRKAFLDIVKSEYKTLLLPNISATEFENIAATSARDLDFYGQAAKS